MKEVLSIYEARIEMFSLSRKRYNHQLRISGIIRLLAFLATIAGIYFFWNSWQAAVAIAIAGIATFLILVARHENLKQKRNYYEELLRINEQEIAVGNGDYEDMPAGNEFEEDDHDYSRDIDLFGIGSFFQYLNRTALKEGRQQLASHLTANKIIGITARQEAIAELGKMLDFRQEYEATARLLENNTRPTVIVDWIKSYKPFVPYIYSWLCYLQFAFSLITAVLYGMDVIGGYWLAGVFFIGLLISGRYVKQLLILHNYISELEGFFIQYGKLLELIEKTDFKGVVLQGLKDQVITTGRTASGRLQDLGKAIVRLDQGSNMLMGIFVNAFGLWNLKQTHSIEVWLKENKEFIAPWLEAVAQIDAMNSLGNFAYNHPNYSYPEIKEGDFQLKAAQVIHPLLDPGKAVGNTIDIHTGEFFIITGANMAGKSTFLRTISMSIVMANVGLPIWAESMDYAPIKLITSMRTSDSLKDDESYFFSELKRLKFIVDKMEREKYFIVLDEILKGTNSVDKASGSRKLIEKLTRKNATGIIATHDLSLTEVANEHEHISNYYFDAQIINDELFFDYTFKTGVATNMNASFLLKKMGIV
ncbi:MutS-related protein [Nonlabens marinus]|uniref:MutS-related protein, family 1 n=1 Tax=Nonlabens marinus S1-08 TaxID=1454201 RepID=W8VX04_9FLAO|nr:DNA mismatch repair protein MutS [Nonlabens marinus]BAO55177.1 MutS-related protein, family 1 [Nonlabens marinus S1-08]